MIWCRSLLTVDPAASAAKFWGAEDGTKKNTKQYQNALHNISIRYTN